MIKGTAGGKFDEGPNPEVEDMRKEIGRLRMELDSKEAGSAGVTTKSSLEKDAKIREYSRKIVELSALHEETAERYRKKAVEDNFIARLYVGAVERKANDDEVTILCEEIDALRRRSQALDPEVGYWRMKYEELCFDSSEINSLRSITETLIKEKKNLAADVEVHKAIADSTEAASKSVDNAAARESQRQIKNLQDQVEFLQASLKEANVANQNLSDANATLKTVANAATIQTAKMEHETKQNQISVTRDKRELETTKEQLVKLHSTIKMGKDMVKKLKRDHEDELTKLQNQLFEESEKLIEAKNGGEHEQQLKARLAGSFKDNAVLVQRLKTTTEERDEVSASEGKGPKVE